MSVSDVFSGIAGFGNTLYNLFTNKRDFDYQKALQQTMFEREDTAVQRRMADLKAAGLNTNLAAGSAAGAGSVVSRSNTNDVDMGSALDMIQALQQIRNQRQQTENAKVEKEILDLNRNKASIDFTLDKMNLFNQLGLNYGIKPVVKNGELDLDFRFPAGIAMKEDTPLYKAFDYQLNYLKNSADLIQKDNNWYTADKISGMALKLLPGINFGFNKRLK